jgi:cathepsin B
VPVKSYAGLQMGEIPESFNTYEKWPQFCHPIRNQERCGSCWAFAASEVLSDRFAIASNGAVNKVLSPEDMVSCDSGDMGCGGGYLDHAWQYLCETGVVTDSCFPYGAGGGRAPACVSKCVDGEPYTKYKAANFYQLKTEEDIQHDIMTYGPVGAARTR